MGRHRGRPSLNSLSFGRQHTGSRSVLFCYLRPCAGLSGVLLAGYSSAFKDKNELRCRTSFVRLQA